MKALVLTQKGTEACLAQEIQEILPTCKVETKEQLALVEVASQEEVAKLTYRTLLGIRVIELIETMDVQELEDFKLEPKQYEQFIKANTTWAVRSKIDDITLLTKQEIEAEVGSQLHEHFTKTQPTAKVQLRNHTILFLVVLVDNVAYIGVDYAGTDLTKREYKIFSSGHSLSGGSAAGFIRLCEFSPEEKTLDPFSHDGTLAIEMALQATKRSCVFYKKEELQCIQFLQKAKEVFTQEDANINKSTTITAFGALLRHLKTSKKNAKVAGVQEAITFSKVHVEDLDLKFEEQTIDRILTMPPNTSVELNEKKMKKMYEEFFYQSHFILKDKGHIGTIGGKIELLKELGEKQGFKLVWEKTLYQGKLPLTVLYFQKAEKKRHPAL